METYGKKSIISRIFSYFFKPKTKYIKIGIPLKGLDESEEEN